MTAPVEDAFNRPGVRRRAGLRSRFRRRWARTLREALGPKAFGALRSASRATLRVAPRLTFALCCSEDYRLSRRGYDIVFLLLGPQFWPNVRPVVKELQRRRPDLRLAVTHPGPRDSIPALLRLAEVTTIANVSMRTSSAIKTKIMYCTAPDLAGFVTLHRRRSAKLVCAPYSLNTIDGTYPDYAFDTFDYIVCQGPDHIAAFRKLALKRPTLAGKQLIPAGYPKLDVIIDSMRAQSPPRERSTTRTVVYAPTHAYEPNDKLTSLRRHGEAIVDSLLRQRYRVIFRPHVASLYDDAEGEAVGRILAQHGHDVAFSYDSGSDYSESYSRADLMVTDVSGTGFTFSFGFGKPAVFFVADAKAEQGLSGLQFEARHRIGCVVRTIDELVRETARLCERDMSAEIEQFRNEAIFNVGTSAANIAERLEEMLSDREPIAAVRL